MKKLLMMMLLTLCVCSQAFGWECTKASKKGGIPEMGTGEVCINNELYVVASGRAATWGANIPANLSQISCSGEAQLMAKKAMSEFVKQGKIKNTQLYKNYMDQGHRSGKEKLEAQTDGVSTKAIKTGDYSDWSRSREEENLYEFEGKALQGMISVASRADENFCYESVGISESTLAVAEQVDMASKGRIAIGKSSRSEKKTAAQLDRGYPTSVPSYEWVNPAFNEPYREGRK